MVYFCF